MIADKIEKIWNPCQSRGYRPFFSRRCSSEIERVAVNTTSECGVIFMKTVNYAKAEKESLVGIIFCLEACILLLLVAETKIGWECMWKYRLYIERHSLSRWVLTKITE